MPTELTWQALHDATLVQIQVLWQEGRVLDALEELVQDDARARGLYAQLAVFDARCRPA